MSAHPTDGGPAFPHTHEEFERGAIGMSLRDYFAAKSMHAHRLNDIYAQPEKVAAWSYEDADAMLLAREAKR